MPTTPVTSLSRVLLGRAAVLDRADVLVAALRGGTGGLLWVRGDAGIGKSSVLTEIGDRARRARGRPCCAAPPPTRRPARRRSGSGPRSCARPATGDPQALVALGGPRARRAAELVDPDASGDSDPQPANRFPLFDGVLAVLDGLTAEFPVVLLLDDLHWADTGSLHLLRFLLPSLATRPVLVVCGWRDHEVLAGSDRDLLAAEIAAAGESWPLAGLGPDDVAALIAATGGQHVGPDEAAAVAGRTSGNPLFVSEMARLAAARGAAVSEMVPETAQGAIRRRVARLPQPAQHVLTVAAVLGQEAALDPVRTLAGLDPDAFVAGLDAVVASGLARHEGDRLALSHALVRDAVYDATPADRRRELHLEAADVPGLLPAEVAGHLLHARPLADLDRVVAATEEAARAAHDAQAWEDATRLYRLALELAPADADARPRLLRGAGAALLDAADLEAARVLYREAADLARRAGDARGLAEAALGFAAGLGGFEVRLVDREQNELLDEALTALGDDEPALRVHLMARLAVGLAFTEDADRIPQLSAEAVALARATGDARALGAALAAHCDAVAGPDHVDVRTAEATEIVDLGRSLGDLGLELLGLRLRVVAHWESGSMLEADADVREFGRLAERLGQPQYSWYVPLWRGAAAHLAGDLALVARCADEVQAYAGPADSRNAFVLGMVQRAWSLIERGATAESMTEIMAAFGDWIELSPDGGNLVMLFHGQPHDMRVRAAADLPRLLAELPKDKEWLPNLHGVSGGLLESDLGGEPAALVHAELAPYAHLYLVDGIGAGLAGSVERPLGNLAMLAGDLDGAAGHFERALAANTAIGAPLAVANTRREYAELLRRRGAPGDAERRADLLREADAFYRSVGILERVSTVDPPTGGERQRAVGAHRRRLVGHVPRPHGGTTGGQGDGRPRAAARAARGGGARPRPGRCGRRARRPRQGDLGDVLDDRARAAYRQRLHDLDERLADAEADGDDDAAARVTEEREFLVAELTGAYGLGGRPRRAGDPAEKARTTVTSRIRDAIGRVESVHPDLGRHLRASVRTGTFCSYAPERPVVWDVREVVPTS